MHFDSDLTLLRLSLVQSSRKNRYPEDFGWNLQSLVASLLESIRRRHGDPAVKVTRGGDMVG